MRAIRTADALRLRMHYADAGMPGLGEAGHRTALCGEITYDEIRYQQITGRELRDDEHFDLLPVCAACSAVAGAHSELAHRQRLAAGFEAANEAAS